MLIKFDFSSKTGILVVKFAFATPNLKIETLRMRRRFARVFVKTYLSNVTSGYSPVTTSGPPFAGKVDLEAFCLPQGGFEYIVVSRIHQK